MFSDRLFEKGQARACDQFVFVLPGPIIHEIIFETSVSDAIAAIDVAQFIGPCSSLKHFIESWKH
jgi:hypothetical protein